MVLSLPSLEKKCKSLLKKKIHESLITKSELMKSLSDRTSGALLKYSFLSLVKIQFSQFTFW